MEKEISLIVPMMNREFLKGSYNGTALMQTLDGLSFKDVLSVKNPAAMSAWEVFCHVIFCKFVILDRMAEGDLPKSVPFEMTDFPPLPETPSEKEWEELKSFGRDVHDRLIAALSEGSSEGLDRDIPAWKCTVRDTVAWLPGHDAYHNAQIRNSGLTVPEPVWE